MLGKEVKNMAIIECTGDPATVRFTDGSSQQIAQSVLDRSSLIRQALDDTVSDATSSVHVPEDVLRSWLQWIKAAPAVISDPGLLSVRSADSTYHIPQDTLVGYLEVWVLCNTRFMRPIT